MGMAAVAIVGVVGSGGGRAASADCSSGEQKAKKNRPEQMPEAVIV